MTKREAEQAGWRFVHSKPAETEYRDGVVSRHHPASLRAEKSYSPPGRPCQLVNEESDNLGLLLKRIALWEESHAGLQ